jgi:hypothetical protein
MPSSTPRNAIFSADEGIPKRWMTRCDHVVGQNIAVPETVMSTNAPDRRLTRRFCSPSFDTAKRAARVVPTRRIVSATRSKVRRLRWSSDSK